MSIDYRVNAPLTVDEFISLLNDSGLGQRRPVADRDCVAQMLQHGNLTISAWQEQTLVGVARSVTDYAYCCYLSDLAVSRRMQRAGVGKALLWYTTQQLGPRCKLILLAAPAAVGYYPRLGFQRHEQAWLMDAAAFEQLRP